MCTLFGGGSAPDIAAFGGALSAIDPSSPYSVSAALTLNTDGSNTRSLSPSTVTNTVGANWSGAPAVGVGTGIYVRATRTAGTDPTGGSGLDTWLELSSARSWSNSRATAGTTTSTLLLEFSRSAAGAPPFASQSVTLTATATP